MSIGQLSDAMTAASATEAFRRRRRPIVVVGSGSLYLRCILAGYDNGDVKMYDLRMGKVRWETNVKNGVCGIEFDRKEIQMNKFVITTLESQFRLYDARTEHPKKGFSSLVEKVNNSATVGAWPRHPSSLLQPSLFCPDDDCGLALGRAQLDQVSCFR